MSGREPTFYLRLRANDFWAVAQDGLAVEMAVQLDAIRATAERVAGSYGLDVVEIEFQGGVKFRTLRIYIEKNAAERAKLAEAAAAVER